MLAKESDGMGIQALVGCLALAITSTAASPVSAAFLMPLGDLPGGGYFSEALDVSADGLVVVGSSETAAGREAFRWTLVGGMESLGRLGGGSGASAVSGDGAVVVGYSGPGAFRWTRTEGMVALTGFPSGYAGYASDVSADGGTVSGTMSLGTFETQQAFRWTLDGGVQGLGALPGHEVSIGNAVSDDGTTIVGESDRSDPFALQATRWTSSAGPQGLGDLPFGVNNDSIAYGVSADGSVVVGVGNLIEDPEAFRWTAADGMRGLGFVRGDPRSGWPNYASSRADAVSPDGSVVVGTSYFPSEQLVEAFVWDEGNGMQSLQAVLESQGVDVSEWTALFGATGVSADGLTIVGNGIRNGRTEAFVARLGPTPVPLPGALGLFAGGLLGAARRRGSSSVSANLAQNF